MKTPVSLAWGVITTALLYFAFGMDMAKGFVVVTEKTVAEYDSAWLNRVWFADLLAGGVSGPEGKIGGPGGYFPTATDTIQTTWTDGGNNPFTLSVDSANNLNLVWNGVGTGDGYPITSAFNEVWVHLRINTQFAEDTISVNNHLIDGASLPNMFLQNPYPIPGFSVFKIHFSDRMANIGQFNMSGNIVPDMFIEGGAIDENFRYRVFGVNNPNLVPEPSSVILLLVGVFTAIVRRTPYPSG